MLSTDPNAKSVSDRPDSVLRRFRQWMYKDGHPNRLARVLNRISAIQFSTGWVLASRLGTLEVVGRRSGRVISFPIAVADYRGARYVVAMLGEQTSWVRNVRAADGQAMLRHGRREAVQLDEVPVDERAPILKRYLAIAPGARSHIPVDRRAPVKEFERIAAQYPVFRITSVG